MLRKQKYDNETCLRSINLISKTVLYYNNN